MYEWDDKYSVGISKIDEAHKEYIDCINKAIAIKENNGNPEELKEVLYGLITLKMIHFSTEEDYMSEFNYPEYQHHLEEHNDFSKKTNAYCKKVDNGELYLLNEMLEFLREWLVDHVLVTDRKFIDCFK